MILSEFQVLGNSWMIYSTVSVLSGTDVQGSELDPDKIQCLSTGLDTRVLGFGPLVTAPFHQWY